MAVGGSLALQNPAIQFGEKDVLGKVGCGQSRGVVRP